MKSKAPTGSTVNKCPCGKILKNKPAWIACDSCNQWWHGNCVNLTKQICGIFKEKKLPFTCPFCIVDKVNNDKLNSSVAGTVESDNVLCAEQKNHSDLEKSSPDTHHIPLDNKTKHLVIIDGIKDPGRFQNSTDIQKEIRKYKGGIQLKYVYPLNRGGIAVHVEKEEEVEILKEEWPEEAFSSGSSLSVRENCVIPRCVFKNIPAFLSSEFINEEVVKQTGVVVNSKRLRYRDTRKPMPVVVATCKSHEDLQILLKAKISIKKKTVKIVSYQSKRYTPTRCFNCQEFGHIAVYCKKKTKV